MLVGGAALTFAAHTINHQPVARPRESARLGDECGDAFQALVAKFFDFSARRAEQVFVMRHIARRFEPAKPFAEIPFDNQATVEEHVDSAIHRRGADFLATGIKLGGDFVGGEMTVGMQEHIGHGKARCRHGQIVLAQPGAKAVDYGAVCHDGS